MTSGSLFNCTVVTNYKRTEGSRDNFFFKRGNLSTTSKYFLGKNLTTK